MEKEHLLGKTLEELQTVAEENGLPRFAAKQIASWLYEKRIDHIAGMSNLSLKHRELLSQPCHALCFFAGGLQDEL